MWASCWPAWLSRCYLSPYYLLDWNEFRAALVEQSQELTGGYALVSTWQFIGTTPYAFEASNLANWSVGVASGISGFAGWGCR